MSSSVIRVEKIGKQYRVGALEGAGTGLLRDKIAGALRNPLGLFKRKPKETFWALKDISFEVKEGEVLGLIGRNGAGKSTLLKILSRITKPTVGHAEIHGRVGSLLEVGTGFHPELSGRENVFLNGAILGMGRREITRKFDEIVAFAEVEKFIDTPVKHYSSGMYIRLAFAVAAHLETEILFVDEVLSVGDLAFQKKCLGKMGDVAQQGRTIIFVSHQMIAMRRLCRGIAWIDGGRVRMSGQTQEVVAAYESEMLRGQPERDAKARRNGAKGHFVSWEVIEPRGYESNVIEGLGPVTIKMTLQVREPIRRATHGISLYNQERELMWGWAAYDFDIPAGEREFIYRLPSLPLRPGMYNFAVSLADYHESVDVWECVPELVVATDPMSHPRDEWSGILNLPAKFSVQ